MGKKTKGITYLRTSIVGYLIFSLSFLIMPLEPTDASQTLGVLMILSGVLFWIGLLLGAVMQIILSVMRKKWFAENRIRPAAGNQPRLGLISFFKNKTAIVFDILLFLSLVGFVVANTLSCVDSYIRYVCIALVSFTFCCHCIFNGKNYYFIHNRESLRNQTKKTRTRASVRERSKENGND